MVKQASLLIGMIVIFIRGHACQVAFGHEFINHVSGHPQGKKREQKTLKIKTQQQERGKE